VLPTILGNSNNRDLNNIDSETLADLMEGKFKDQVSSSIRKHQSQVLNIAYICLRWNRFGLSMPVLFTNLKADIFVVLKILEVGMKRYS
jgi:hypothetical protein